MLTRAVLHFQRGIFREGVFFGGNVTGDGVFIIFC